MFQGRMPVDKKKLILEYEKRYPAVLATIAYGSGAIIQQNSNLKDKKQIDPVMVCNDKMCQQHVFPSPCGKFPFSSLIIGEKY